MNNPPTPSGKSSTISEFRLGLSTAPSDSLLYTASPGSTGRRPTTLAAACPSCWGSSGEAGQKEKEASRAIDRWGVFFRNNGYMAGRKEESGEFEARNFRQKDCLCKSILPSFLPMSQSRNCGTGREKRRMLLKRFPQELRPGPRTRGLDGRASADTAAKRWRFARKVLAVGLGKGGNERYVAGQLRTCLCRSCRCCLIREEGLRAKRHAAR